MSNNIALQSWVCESTTMEQGTLFSGLRGPDGVPKQHPVKSIVKFYRRCLFNTAFERRPINNPYSEGGGQYTGPVNPSETPSDIIRGFIANIDSLPFHFIDHFIQAIKIVAYRHPDADVRQFWTMTYRLFCLKLHVLPENVEQTQERKTDDHDKWLLERANKKQIHSEIARLWDSERMGAEVLHEKEYE